MKCKPRKYANGGTPMLSGGGIPYADGGKIGKPTFAKSVAAKAGLGDGYNYFPPKAPKAKDKDADKRLTISNSPDKLSEALAKQKAELSSYANGGKVKKRKGC